MRCLLALSLFVCVASCKEPEPVCSARNGQPCARYNTSCTTSDGVSCFCGSDLTYYCGLWQDLSGHYDLSTPDLSEPPDLRSRDSS